MLGMELNRQRRDYFAARAFPAARTPQCQPLERGGGIKALTSRSPHRMST
jgi:hypothetical protein